MTNQSWLSGFVPASLQQSINPWRFIFDPSGQFGLVNVSVNSDNPDMERKIVEDVASYGRQLGRLTDAMMVVLNHLPALHLQPDERKAIAAFEELAQRIDAAKNGVDIPDEAGVRQLIEGIAFLKTHDSAGYGRVTTRLRDVMAPAAVQIEVH